MDRIELTGMRFMAGHGVADWERAAVRPFVVDIMVELDLRRAGQSDDVADTVSYACLHDLAREVVLGAPTRLLERLAEQIADRVLATTPVAAVEVTVGKPQPPIPHSDVALASVRIRRRRCSDCGA